MVYLCAKYNRSPFSHLGVTDRQNILCILLVWINIFHWLLVPSLCSIQYKTVNEQQRTLSSLYPKEYNSFRHGVWINGVLMYTSTILSLRDWSCLQIKPLEAAVACVYHRTDNWWRKKSILMWRPSIGKHSLGRPPGPYRRTVWCIVAGSDCTWNAEYRIF